MENRNWRKKALYWGMGVVLFFLVFIFLFYFFTPLLFSSDWAKKRVSLYLSQSLNRPVKIESLFFSWRKGITITGVTISNQDRSPFLELGYFQFIPEWTSLLGEKLKITYLRIAGIRLTLIRDTPRSKVSSPAFFSQTSYRNFFVSPNKVYPKHLHLIFAKLAAHFTNAHITGGDFIFIDRYLQTTTEIKDFSADINLSSPKKPTSFFLKGLIIVNNNPPELIELKGTAELGSPGSFDLGQVRGRVNLKAGFGYGEGFFDGSKFTPNTPLPLGSLFLSLDLNKLSQVLAGIIGFPPGYSWEGKLNLTLTAQCDLASQVRIKGLTKVTNFSITGGNFLNTPLIQPQIELTQDILLNLPAQKMEVKAFQFQSDFLQLFLSGSIDKISSSPSAKLTLSGRGDLSKVVQIGRNFFLLPPELNLAGMIQIFLSGTGNLKDFHINGTSILKELRIDHPWLKGKTFKEKEVKILPNLAGNLKKKHYIISSLSIRSNCLEGEVKGKIDRENNLALEGNIFLKFSHLRSQLPEVIPPFLSGAGSSSSRFLIKGNFESQLRIKGEHYFPFLQNLSLSHEINYSPKQAKLTFTFIKARSLDWLDFTGRGEIVPISPNPIVNAAGSLTIKLENLPDSVRLWLPEGITGKGKASFDFTGKGPLYRKNNRPLISFWAGGGKLGLNSIEYPAVGAIKDLRSQNCSLEKGILKVILLGELNDGPTKMEVRVDFNQKNPKINLLGEGREINLSRRQKILSYVLPFSSNSTLFTGKGSFSLEATWQGINWEQEISRNITGKGVLNIREGTIQSPKALSPILKFLGKSETLYFDQIYTQFRFGEGKIFNDSIQITGEDIELELKGWTSLVYEPKKKGNPIEYQIKGDTLKKTTKKGGQKLLPFLTQEALLPVYISGTVQKPKVSFKPTEVKEFLKKFLEPEQKFFP